MEFGTNIIILEQASDLGQIKIVNSSFIMVFVHDELSSGGSQRKEGFKSHMSFRGQGASANVGACAYNRRALSKCCNLTQSPNQSVKETYEAGPDGTWQSIRMKLLLIRHGETVDNVAQILTNASAGTKDSALTIHGSLQADRLSQYLSQSGYRFTHIFSSDLQRAFKTAEALRVAQVAKDSSLSAPNVNPLSILREQDFGYYEGRPFYTRDRDLKQSGKDNHRAKTLNDPNFKDVESKEAMERRMRTFLDEYLIPILRNNKSMKEPVVAVVSHGIILSTLWKCLLKRFEAQSVKLARGLTFGSGGYVSLEHLGGWSNTGYLEIDIQDSTLVHTIDVIDAIHINNSQNDDMAKDNISSLLMGWKMTIKTINGKEHLKNLKRTGGGVGSSKFDEGQRKIETFFVSKRTKTG
ncbi:MAG: hypothetical protein Q9187_008448 [Circinaria calcarea]